MNEPIINTFFPRMEVSRKLTEAQQWLEIIAQHGGTKDQIQMALNAVNLAHFELTTALDKLQKYEA